MALERPDKGGHLGSGNGNGRMTMIIVPKDTPGVRIVRGVEIWDRRSDHCEITYENVRVPLENTWVARRS